MVRESSTSQDIRLHEFIHVAAGGVHIHKQLVSILHLYKQRAGIYVKGNAQEAEGKLSVVNRKQQGERKSEMLRSRR